MSKNDELRSMIESKISEALSSKERQKILKQKEIQSRKDCMFPVITELLHSVLYTHNYVYSKTSRKLINLTSSIVNVEETVKSLLNNSNNWVGDHVIFCWKFKVQDQECYIRVWDSDVRGNRKPYVNQRVAFNHIFACDVDDPPSTEAIINKFLEHILRTV